MRNYNTHNQYQSSKEYYHSLLKSKKNNLNSSKQKNDKLDDLLEKLLTYSYSFFSPLFNEADINTAQLNTNYNYIDEPFDEKTQSYTPLWIQNIYLLLIKTYNSLFPKEVQELIKKKSALFYAKLTQSRTKAFAKPENKFFNNKASP